MFRILAIVVPSTSTAHCSAKTLDCIYIKVYFQNADILQDVGPVNILRYIINMIYCHLRYRQYLGVWYELPMLILAKIFLHSFLNCAARGLFWVPICTERECRV